VRRSAAGEKSKIRMKIKIRRMIRREIRIQSSIGSGIPTMFPAVEDPNPALSLALNPLHDLPPHLNLSLLRRCKIAHSDLVRRAGARPLPPGAAGEGVRQ
jgi:hypothetical protein